jgi:hypothetical protein
MHVLYYASTLWCWHLVWILVRTNHPCLGVGCHKKRGASGRFWDICQVPVRNFNWLPFTPLWSPSLVLQLHYIIP